MKTQLLSLWHRARRRLGAPGIAALVLALPAAAIIASLPQLVRDSEARRAQLLARTAAAAVEAPVKRRLPEGEQVREFTASFPSLTQNASDLEQVFRCAQRHNVQLNKGEYQLKREPNAPFVTYTATFPMRNDYATFKDFAAEVLRALPHVSMDELRMARNDAGATALDSVVRFTFVYRRTGS